MILCSDTYNQSLLLVQLYCGLLVCNEIAILSSTETQDKTEAEGQLQINTVSFIQKFYTDSSTEIQGQTMLGKHVFVHDV